MPIQIEDFLRGLATGSYTRQLGSQFGSVWQFDGLIEAEATPQEYAAFGASGDVQLGHGQGIEWLGRKWAVILAYRRHGLAQVSIHTNRDSLIIDSTTERLTLLIGKPRQSDSTVWVGSDGVVTITEHGVLFQLDAGQFTPFQRLLAKIRRLF
jgi:hypothetical protein